MKTSKILCLIIFLLFSSSAFAFQHSDINSDETLLIFVRHTEKADDGTRNPPLNPEGVERANSLASILSEIPVSAIYSTDYKRTTMTAIPAAYHFKLPIKTYDFNNLDSFLSSLISEHRGKAVLIVGHSNTTPRLVNLVMEEERLAQIDEKKYGDLFMLYTKSKGESKLVIKQF